MGAALAAGLALLLCIATALASGVPLGQLGVYFDGHLYIQIARSYPLPYPPEAHLYVSHAPGYPAAIALGRVLLPDAAFNWAELAVLASWLGTVASAAVFHLLVRAWGIASPWPTILFVAANPRWLAIGASPHAEPLAMLFALAALLAFKRDRTGWSLAFLSVATLCRFPALVLGAPLAWGLLVERRRWEMRTLLWLASPLATLGLLHLYLAARIPDFVSIWHSHEPFWSTELVMSFEFLSQGDLKWPAILPLREVTYAILALYGVGLALALRPSLRDGRVLALWIAAPSLLSLSLSGELGITDFTRLALLAWPAAVLAVWSAVGARLPRVAVATLAAAATIFSVAFAAQQTQLAVAIQDRGQPDVQRKLGRVDSNEPLWIQKPYADW
jgi:hypothetical protein